MYMWRCLRRCLDQERHPLLDAEFLAHLTNDQFDQIFADDFGNNPLSIARSDRILNLRNLGEHLLEHWDGDFYWLLNASGGSVVTFARLSRLIRAFDDPIQKLTMVNAILHSGSRVFEFTDALLPGVDYELLRQLLRQGIVHPTEDVARKLRQVSLLSASEAYELRRVAMSALLELSERTGVSGEVLDNRYWWNRDRCTESAPVCERPDEAATCPFYGACGQRVELHRPLELTRYY
jgi:hypothetical protein